MVIEKINTSSDVKKLNIEECKSLAEEIRQLIIKKTSACGGHLASNLGVVELTIALHYVFDMPYDRLVFDVSHQSMPHKMITGRKNAYLEADNYNTVTGYTNPEESEFDLFKIGHTATSVSLACGLAKARDMAGSKEKVIAVIGDGSLSGGEAFEGLNFAGSEIKGGLIIIINDNQNSIAENHGGLYENLKLLRDTSGKAECNFFKALGFDYKFLKNGNSLEDLTAFLTSAKDIERPTVLHICTVKGKGYEFAENNTEIAHFVRPYDVETGKEKKAFVGERYDVIMRDFLLEKMKKDRHVFTIVPAVPDVLAFSPEIRERAGEQFIDVAIAEEHAVAMAAGIAKAGGKPVMATKSTFYQRAFDQIHQDLCINNLPVTMIICNASAYVPTDSTHQGIYDIAMMSNIPNLVCLAPTNKEEYLKMTEWSIEQTEYPVAIRAPRNGVFYARYDVDSDYSDINKFQLCEKGSGIAIIALGDFFQIGEELREAVKQEFEMDATLINPRFITGLDTEMLMRLADEHDIVITLEDGQLEGGFGQKVAAFYGTGNMKVLNYGLKKMFYEGMTVSEIFKDNRLEPELMIADLRKLMHDRKD